MDKPSLTVFCIACRKTRPATLDVCPHCGAKPYRHKTADPQEFWENVQQAWQRNQ